MSQDWRYILRFAIVGLAVAAMFYAFFKTDSLVESCAATWMSWASLAICPGYFVYILAVAGGELPIPDSALVWLVIGPVNCFYYTSIGAVYVDMRKPRSRVAKI